KASPAWGIPAADDSPFTAPVAILLKVLNTPAPTPCSASVPADTVVPQGSRRNLSIKPGWGLGSFGMLRGGGGGGGGVGGLSGTSGSPNSLTPPSGAAPTTGSPNSFTCCSSAMIIS